MPILFLLFLLFLLVLLLSQHPGKPPPVTPVVVIIVDVVVAVVVIVCETPDNTGQSWMFSSRPGKSIGLNCFIVLTLWTKLLEYVFTIFGDSPNLSLKLMICY